MSSAISSPASVGGPTHCSWRYTGAVSGAQAEGSGEWQFDGSGAVRHSSGGTTGSLANAEQQGPQGRLRGRQDTQREDIDRHARRDGTVDQLAQPEGSGRRQERSHGGGSGLGDSTQGRPAGLMPGGDVNQSEPAGPTNGHWAGADWIYCRDNKFRPVKPGLEPLVNGVSGRARCLRGYGNAIVPQQAALFIETCFEVMHED
jgi:DNA (cytosine-5)-methyltransferase 1